jgi:hypothetical protein
MKDDPSAIEGCNLMDMMGTRDGAGDGCSVSFIVHSFAGKENRTAAGKLQDDRRINVAGCFQDGVDAIGANDVCGRQSKLIGLGVSKDFLDFIAGYNTGWDGLF